MKAARQHVVSQWSRVTILRFVLNLESVPVRQIQTTFNRFRSSPLMVISVHQEHKFIVGIFYVNKVEKVGQLKEGTTRDLLQNATNG